MWSKSSRLRRSRSDVIPTHSLGWVEKNRFSEVAGLGDVALLKQARTLFKASVFQDMPS